MPQGVPQGMPQGIQGMPQGMQGMVPQGMQGMMPQGTPQQGVPQYVVAGAQQLEQVRLVSCDARDVTKGSW